LTDNPPPDRTEGEAAVPSDITGEELSADSAGLGARIVPQAPPEDRASGVAEPSPAPPRSVEAASLTKPESVQPLPPAVRKHRSLFIARCLQALWLGSGAFLMFLGAPAAFRSAGSSTDAANVVGAMLTRWHYMALLIPALLMMIEWHRMRPRVVTLLFVAVLAAALQAGADIRIRALRQQSIAAISSLSPEDPVRRQFGLLHGISSLLMLVEVICAVATIAVEPDQESE
jgi:hypothetical protein